MTAEFDSHGTPVRPWMWNFTPPDQDVLKRKVLDYIEKHNVFGDHFSEHELLQLETLLERPAVSDEHWRERAEHAESVLEEQDHNAARSHLPHVSGADHG